MPRLLLLRHAQSEWNAAGRWQGLADPPLSRHGIDQAAAAGRRLQTMGISALVSSDLRRARATAELMAPTLDLAEPITLVAGLREYDVGAWSGLTRPEIEARWPGAIDDWRHGRLFSTPGGERRDAFVARISAAVSDVAADRPAETTLVVTHGGVIAALCRSLGSPARRFGHLAGVWIDADGVDFRAGTLVSLLDRQPLPAEDGSVNELTRSGVLDTPGR